MLIALALVLCALPVGAGAAAEASYALSDLEAIVAQALPDREVTEQPVGSGTLMGARVRLSEGGEPAMDLLYFLLEASDGQHIRAWVQPQTDAYTISEADVDAVNALMADWNADGSHVEIEYTEYGVPLIYTDSQAMPAGSDAAIAQFVSYVFDDIRGGLAELRTRAAAYLPEVSADAAEVAITMDMVKAVAERLSAERGVVGTVGTASVDESTGKPGPGDDYFTVDISKPGAPELWLMIRLEYGNTVCIDLWDQNESYTVVGAAISDATAAADQWNTEGNGQRVWLEYGEDGTMYGEFGIVMGHEITEDQMEKYMTVLAGQACDALEFLDEKLAGRFAEPRDFDDFTLLLPAGAEVTASGKQGSGGECFAVTADGDGTRLRCLWSAEVVDQAKLSLSDLASAVLGVVHEDARNRGLADDSVSVVQIDSDTMNVGGRDGSVTYVVYMLDQSAIGGDTVLRYTLTSVVADPAFGTYFFICDLDSLESLYSIHGMLTRLRWNVPVADGQAAKPQ